MMLPLIRPDVGFDEVEDDLRTIFESGHLTSGRYVAEFEASVAGAVGVDHALSTTSATTALHLSLVGLGVGPGDEVLVSDFTFPASGNVIAQVGATPVLVDSRPDSFDLDVEDAARKVTGRTKAIMVVHPFGQPADLDAVAGLAESGGLAVIEDAACALGSSRDGVACGSRFVGCFSFHPRKVVTTGEGGAITTSDEELAERLRLLRNHGGRRVDVGFEFVEHGFNYRLGEVPAAIGLAQLRRLDEIIGDRRTTAHRYEELLADVAGVELRSPADGVVWSYQSFVVMLDEGVDRSKVMAAMRDDGIETTLGTYAMHAHPAFGRLGYQPGDLPNSWVAQERSLTLPVLPRMDPLAVEQVVDRLAAEVGSAHG